MPAYQLTALARKDLREIARYTLRQWGPDQAKRYQESLEACFQSISREELRPRKFLERRPDLLYTRCKHHYVFYLRRKGKSSLIIAVYHEKMDLMNRLKTRLQ